MTTGIVIPAHMGSTRFPGKPLALVGGKPLLSYAVEAARASGIEFTVATPDNEIMAWCDRNSVPYSWTITPCRNGTERAALIIGNIGWDRVIVLQCDEPDVTGEDLLQFTRLRRWLPCTLGCPMGPEDRENPNSVSVVVEDDLCLFFERAAPRGYECFRLRHVGLYVYHAEMLSRYLEYPPTPAEESQRLEQLRTMGMGYAWHIKATTKRLRSVNVPADVEKFKEDARLPVSQS